jgi:hypothetical protein
MQDIPFAVMADCGSLPIASWPDPQLAKEAALSLLPGCIPCPSGWRKPGDAAPDGVTIRATLKTIIAVPIKTLPAFIFFSWCVVVCVFDR